MCMKECMHVYTWGHEYGVQKTDIEVGSLLTMEIPRRS